MFVDFDKTFHPDESWMNEKITQQDPCKGCDEPQYFKNNPYYQSEKCHKCAKYTLWVHKCLQKLVRIEKQTEGEWISVEDRLPEKDGRYLVAMKNGDDYHISTRRFKRAELPVWWKGITYGRWSRHTGGVRYWQPLPEPPKGE